MAWESPRLRRLSSRFPLLPGPGGDGEEVQVHSQRQQQRWCWGGDGRQKGGWGGERSWPESCVPGFRSGLRRVVQSIRGGVLVQNGGTIGLPEGSSRSGNHHSSHKSRF